MRVLVNHSGKVVDRQLSLPQKGEVAWVHFSNPSDEDMHELGNVFGCHPLAVEDMIHFGQRPKLDHYSHVDYPQVFISFYSFATNLRSREFCLVVSENFVITVERDEVPELHELYERARTASDLWATPGMLVYRILDACVDNYFRMIDELEDRVDEIEEHVFNSPQEPVAPEIFRLKRRLQRIRRLVSDSRNVLGMLSHDDFPFTSAEHAVYFVDVYDHVSRVVDALDGVRDNLSGLLDLQTNQRANRMNEIMKTLTIISTIFLPLTFITGLYGMNFRDIPELAWPFGYLYAWGLIVFVTATLLVYFKRKGWW